MKLLPPPSRTEVQKQIAKFQGAAAAKKIGNNFTLITGAGTPLHTCFSTENDYSQVWGGDVVDQTNSSTKSYGVIGEYRVRQADNNGKRLVTWTGVGGLCPQACSSSSYVDLVQDGVEQDPEDAGRLFAWYEFYPAAANGVMWVNANDLMYTAVNETSQYEWLIYIEDMSTSPVQIYSQTMQALNASNITNTAEWITEFPSGSGTIPYFSGVTFSNSWWIDVYGGEHTITDHALLHNVELYAAGVFNCIRTSNQGANGFQNNWVTLGSCP